MGSPDGSIQQHTLTQDARNAALLLGAVSSLPDAAQHLAAPGVLEQALRLASLLEGFESTPQSVGAPKAAEAAALGQCVGAIARTVVALNGELSATVAVRVCRLLAKLLQLPTSDPAEADHWHRASWRTGRLLAQAVVAAPTGTACDLTWRCLHRPRRWQP